MAGSFHGCTYRVEKVWQFVCVLGLRVNERLSGNQGGTRRGEELGSVSNIQRSDLRRSSGPRAAARLSEDIHYCGV